MSSYYYLDLSLEFGKNLNREVTPAFFKKHITDALQTLFGEVAKAVDVDLLRYNQKERRAIIRVPSDYYSKLHNSLTLCGFYEEEPCAFRVHKTSPLLLALIGSRYYNH